MIQRRDPVVVAWVLGLGLAALAYAVGPQHFRTSASSTGSISPAWRLGEIIGDLSLVAQDVVRALAIGLYATFVVSPFRCCAAAAGRAGRWSWSRCCSALILIGGTDMVNKSNARWTAALALSAVGAVVMTGRLRQTALVPRTY